MTQEIQVQDKREVSGGGEQTRPGRVFVPSVDIFETEEGMTLVADMPGVDKEGLEIDLRDNVLTVKGEVKPALTGEVKLLYREYDEGDYRRSFTLSEVIDQENISAKLKNGVLNLFLPKVKPAQPRRIEVQAE